MNANNNGAQSGPYAFRRRRTCNATQSARASRWYPPSSTLTSLPSQWFRATSTIASVIQHEPQGEEGSQQVPLVIMTHTATEGDTQEAVREMDTLKSVRPGSVRLRVLD